MRQYLKANPGFWYSVGIHGVLFTLLFLYSTKSILSSKIYRQVVEFKIVSESSPQRPTLEKLLPTPQSHKPPGAIKAEAAPKSLKVAPDKAPKEAPQAAAPASAQVESNADIRSETVFAESEKLVQANSGPAPTPAPVAIPEPPKKIVLSQTQSSFNGLNGAWGAYGHQLSLAAAKVKHYPVAAITNRMSGSVQVLVTVKAENEFEFRINSSSGFKLLDDEALKMVEQATKSVALPPELKNKNKELIIPINFSL